MHLKLTYTKVDRRAIQKLTEELMSNQALHILCSMFKTFLLLGSFQLTKYLMHYRGKYVMATVSF